MVVAAIRTPRMHGRRPLVVTAVLVALGVLLAVVPHPAPADAVTAADQDVYCRSYYRNSDYAAVKTGTRITLRDDGDSGVNRWRDLVFKASYSAEFDPESGSVSVSVKQRGRSQPLTMGLYQAGTQGFYNTFGATRQGFTGMLYVRDPNSPASLQFACKAVPEP